MEFSELFALKSTIFDSERIKRTCVSGKRPDSVLELKLL